MKAPSLADLNKQAHNPDAKQRRAAIEALGARIQDSSQREDALSILCDLIEREPDREISARISRILTEATNTKTVVATRHTLEVTCPYCNHRNPFNSAQLQQTSVVIFMGADDFETRTVTCPDCHKDFPVDLAPFYMAGSKPGLVVPSGGNPAVEPVKGRLFTSYEEDTIKTFKDVNLKQLDFLNEAGKRIIELSTGMLGILFAAIAFGSDFPPAYLKNDLDGRGLAFLTVLFFFLSLLTGFVTVQPRAYRYVPGNPSQNQKELYKAYQFKAWCFRAGSFLFTAGGFALFLLIMRIIFLA